MFTPLRASVRHTDALNFRPLSQRNIERADNHNLVEGEQVLLGV